MAEINAKDVTSYTSNQMNGEGSSNVQETISNPGSRTNFSDVQNNEENVQPTVSTGLKRKASTSSLNEAKRKRPTEDQVLEESILDPEDSQEKIKNLMFHVDALKAECIWKDNQIEKLKVELTEKVEEIRRLLATNNRYKSGELTFISQYYFCHFLYHKNKSGIFKQVLPVSFVRVIWQILARSIVAIHSAILVFENG